MTVIVAQTAALIVILSALFAWVNWVRSAHRVVNAPERLNEVLIVGHGSEVSPSEARAITVGIAGALAEHQRDIAIINLAAARDTGEIKVPEIDAAQPSPMLIATRGDAAQLDLAVEVFGTKVDAKGIRSWFVPARQPGSLDVSVVFDKTDASGTRTGVASANFPENRDYAFSLPVSGPPSTVARQIAMRFLQVDYAKRNPFFAGLKGEDFVTFWTVRREAAEIALRSSGGGTTRDELERETGEALARIKPLAERYPQWADAQRLAGYLAGKAGNADAALAYLGKAQSAAGLIVPTQTPPVSTTSPAGANIVTPAPKAQPPEVERQLEAEIRRLSAARALQNVRLAEVAPEAGEAASTGSLQEQVLSQPALENTRVAALSQEAATRGRKVRIFLLLGRPSEFPQFGDRIKTLEREGGARDFDRSHTDTVVGLLAALAPTAEIVVVPILGPRGSSSLGDIIQGLQAVRTLRPAPEVVWIGVGPLKGTAINAVLKAVLADGVLPIVPAGNSSALTPQDIAESGALVVGSGLDGRRAEYTNFGPGVSLYAPGDVLTFGSPTELRVFRGGTYASVIVAATAANLAALESTPPGPSRLTDRLLAETREFGGERYLAVQ